MKHLGMSRTRRAFTALAACVALLAGCSSDALPARDVVQRYDTVLSQVKTALEAFQLPYGQAGKRSVRMTDGQCLYYANGPEISGVRDLFRSNEWAQVSTELKRVLADQGFSSDLAPKRQGGDEIITVTDRFGGKLNISRNGQFFIAGVRVDTRDCTLAALGADG